MTVRGTRNRSRQRSHHKRMLTRAGAGVPMFVRTNEPSHPKVQEEIAMTTSTATMGDTELRADVLRELEWEPRINATHIGVALADGIVTLSGHVQSYAEKYAAEDAAKRVHGVRAVVNELEVRLPGSSERTDVDIAEAVVNALKNNTLVPDDRIKVTVSKGWVTLEGDV